MSQIIHNIGTTANDGTGSTLRQFGIDVNHNTTELYNNKEEKSNKTNSVASNITSTLLYPSVKGIVDYINTNVNGVAYLGAVSPSSTPTGTGAATWSATQAGTYTNFGGVVVSANSFATISRSITNTFSISQTPLDLSSYATLSSPSLTGIPTAPTASTGTATNQIANTLFVLNTLNPISLIVNNITDNNIDDWVMPIVDANDRLLGGWKKDGSFLATKYQTNSINGNTLKDGTLNTSKFDAESKSIVPTLLNDENGYVYSVVDANERFLFGVKKDGTFSPAKFSYTIKDNSVTYSQLATDVQNRISFDAPKNIIPCYGDSLTNGAGGGGVSYPSVLQSLLGSNYVVQNCGVGGENVPTIAARQGGVPAIITSGFTLPSDTTSTVEISSDANIRLKNSLTNSNVKWLLQGSPTLINPITVQGIECTLAYNATGGIYTLKRNVASTVSTSIVANSPIYPVGAKIHRNPYSSVIFIGQNGGYTNDAELIDYCKRMIEFAGTDKYILIGLHSGTAASRASLELSMFNAFGLRFINWREYISTYGLVDANLAPTTADEAAMAVGSCPPQFLVDSVHLNPTGYTLLGQQIYKRKKLLGYII